MSGDPFFTHMILSDSKNLIYYLETCGCKIESWRIIYAKPYQYFYKCFKHQNQNIGELFPKAIYLCGCEMGFEKNKNMYVVTKLCNDSINGHLNTPRHMEWPDQGVEIWSKTNKTTPFGWKGIAIST